MIKRITVESAIQIHDRYVCDAVLLDRGKLDGALAAPLAGFGGVDAFPSMPEKAAKLLHSVSSAHAFLDGNKRTGWLCTSIFLIINGLHVVLSSTAAADLAVDLTTGQCSLDEAAALLNSNIRQAEGASTAT